MQYKILSLFFVVVLLAVSAPAFSNEEYEVVQIWACEQDEGTTEAQVEAIAADWLKAVRGVEGGKNATMRVFFPAVVNGAGATDFYFVLNAASFSDWGKIWDEYQDDSELAKSEDRNQGKVTCPDSMLWEAHAINPAP